MSTAQDIDLQTAELVWIRRQAEPFGDVRIGGYFDSFDAAAMAIRDDESRRTFGPYAPYPLVLMNGRELEVNDFVALVNGDFMRGIVTQLEMATAKLRGTT